MEYGPIHNENQRTDINVVGANHMDGVVGVTQKAIAPGEDFTYSFPVSPNQAGTFWYVEFPRELHRLSLYRCHFLLRIGAYTSSCV